MTDIKRKIQINELQAFKDYVKEQLQEIKDIHGSIILRNMQNHFDREINQLQKVGKR